MSNDEEEVGMRLQRAALELFHERGYDRTTATEIAARAGVTERTFFRYFPDKREVLFQGEAVLRTALLAAIADAPDGLSPLDTLFLAFRSVRTLLENNRPFSKPRHEVICMTPALQEREQTKIAALADALAIALKGRGATDLQALLAARTGMAAFALATTAWLDDSSLALGDRLDLAFGELKSLLISADA
jgi:AcrR family transcriptional regulator